MDKSKLFMRMVLNPDFNCKTMAFSFETVFYRTPYSYCCCPCAYQHEYFDYLSDTHELDQKEERHIDEAMFERIVQNIADGRCPHADTVNPNILRPVQFVPNIFWLFQGQDKTSNVFHSGIRLSSPAYLSFTRL